LALYDINSAFMKNTKARESIILTSIKESYKNWKSVAKPSGAIWFFQFVTSLIPSIMNILVALCEAKVVYFLTRSSFKNAAIYLAVAFSFKFVYYISWHIQYVLDSKQLKHIYPKVQEQIFSKLFLTSDAYFKYNSKEKMVNTISNNIAGLSDFCDRAAYKSAYLIEAIILFVVIFSYSLIIGAAMIVTAAIVYLCMRYINHSIARRTNKLYAERDQLTEDFADIVDNRELTSELDVKADLKSKYFEKVDKIVKTYSKRTKLKSTRDNLIFLLYTLILFACTLYIVKLISDNLLTVTLYLVLVPYLSSAIDKLVDFFDIFDDLETANINALRVKTLLDMSENDIIEFGKNKTENLEGSILFSNITYSGEEGAPLGTDRLEKFNAVIEKNQITLFLGSDQKAKNSIYGLLKRNLRPSTGTITLDTINIYDFTKEAYKSNINFISSSPVFYSVSISDNLKMVQKSKSKIIKVMKLVGLHEKIEKLEAGYNTNLAMLPNALSSFEKYLLAFGRAILTNASTLVIESLPKGISESEQKQLFAILKRLKTEKTIIIFSSQENASKIADRVYSVENGAVNQKSAKANIRQKNIVVDSAFSK